MTALRVQQGGSAAVGKQIKQLEKKIQHLKSQIAAPFGGFNDIGPLEVIIIASGVFVDLFLGFFGFVTAGALDSVDWIIDLTLAIYFIAWSLFMAARSSAGLGALPGLVVQFVFTLVIEVLPWVSVLPAWTGLGARIVSSKNKAMMKQEITKLQKTIGELQKQTKGQQRDPVGEARARQRAREPQA